ncbi:hypothetical protein BpHYR1_008869 [Brachionus plicatilis]|uniref:Uncharacterized protein n=1 Tax=Brachionus plicatilis TaxID=10195 RepID=A0A3M7Q040_BRAPC|nr:hypothetical protein BpHYR1_008869 [Brachionus plicatilis]
MRINLNDSHDFETLSYKKILKFKKEKELRLMGCEAKPRLLNLTIYFKFKNLDQFLNNRTIKPTNLKKYLITPFMNEENCHLNFDLVSDKSQHLSSTMHLDWSMTKRMSLCLMWVLKEKYLATKHLTFF